MTVRFSFIKYLTNQRETEFLKSCKGKLIFTKMVKKNVFIQLCLFSLMGMGVIFSCLSPLLQVKSLELLSNSVVGEVPTINEWMLCPSQTITLYKLQPLMTWFFFSSKLKISKMFESINDNGVLESKVDSHFDPLNC